jgi:hypothetical protein
MSMTMNHHGPATRRRDRIEYRLLYACAFAACLPAAAASRLLPGRDGAFRAAGGRRRSILGDARAAADRIAPFAFMA